MRKITILAGIVALFIFIGILWWNNGLSPLDRRDKSQKMFVIEPGSGIRAIANNLEKEGLIKDPIVFFLMVRQKGYDKKIQAGDFRLSPSMTATEIAEAMTKGSLDIWVTIPEGKRAEEIAEILSEKIPTYDESWKQDLLQQEGYLFPETYLVPRDSNSETIITLLTNTFEEKYSQISQKNLDLTKEEIVILASMIEREAKHDEDRALISSVMHNRLEIGMALQIDATIQYAKGKINGNWWTPVTLAEYRSVKSTYNTYLQPGLPPGPISNPGQKSLEAAANPASTNFLYYITDKNGINRYATTGEQHLENIRKYGLSS
ncbi:MAG: Endolytic murein transglycosylase [Patescibacteria group bacterium]|nr:Endolytic murein transglycosylase [Patescibacteria group bacterium]